MQDLNKPKGKDKHGWLSWMAAFTTFSYDADLHATVHASAADLGMPLGFEIVFVVVVVKQPNKL